MVPRVKSSLWKESSLHAGLTYLVYAFDAQRQGRNDSTLDTMLKRLKFLAKKGEIEKAEEVE